jgi:hypothetical protein
MISIDHHTVAAVSLVGSSLDVLGGLYLAYDLLGGQNGPLRLLTRAVTYSIVFGIGYGLGLGLFFGVAAGVATGVTVSIELRRAAHRNDHYPLRWEGLFSAVRAAGFGAGLYRIVGLWFAVIFAVLITVGQIFAYSRGMRPGLDYSASRRPRISRRLFRGVIVRTVGYITTALICSVAVGGIDHAWALALRIGLVTGVVTAVGTTVNPFIEYYADHLPERRLGAYGLALLLCGFALQSFQYWLVIFNVTVT